MSDKSKVTVDVAAVMAAHGWTPERRRSVAGNVSAAVWQAWAIASYYVVAGLSRTAAALRLLVDIGSDNPDDVDTFFGKGDGAFKHRTYVLDAMLQCGVNIAEAATFDDEVTVARLRKIAPATVVDAREAIAFAFRSAAAAAAKGKGASDDSVRDAGQTAAWAAALRFRDADNDARQEMILEARRDDAVIAARATTAAEAAVKALSADAPASVRTAAEAAVETAKTAAAAAVENAKVAPKQRGRKGKTAAADTVPNGDADRTVTLPPDVWAYANAAHDRYNVTLTRGKRPNLGVFVGVAVRAFEASGWMVAGPDWVPPGTGQ